MGCVPPLVPRPSSTPRYIIGWYVLNAAYWFRRYREAEEFCSELCKEISDNEDNDYESCLDRCITGYLEED